jgi:hypothetical protein
MPGMALVYDLFRVVVRQLGYPAGPILAFKALKYKPIVATFDGGGRLRWASLI